MLKRWAIWPRGIRWLGAIGVAVLALAIAWALFVPLADWFARHDVGSVKGSLHETALANARGRLLTLGGRPQLRKTLPLKLSQPRSACPWLRSNGTGHPAPDLR
jgi:hypothetical protein